MSLTLFKQHPQLWQTIEHSLHNHRIANLYLLTGFEDIHVLGNTLANIFMHQSMFFDEQDMISQLLLSGKHPDVLIIEKLLKADVLRLQERLAYASQGEYHIFVIHNLEKASTAAANSLLKVLEESSGVIFIATTKNLNAVLPTIRSRAMLFELNANRDRFDSQVELLFTKFRTCNYVEFLVYVKKVTLDQKMLEAFLDLLYLRTNNLSIREIIYHVREMTLPNLNCLMQLDCLLMYLDQYDHNYYQYFKE